jgi:hypothetical protein
MGSLAPGDTTLVHDPEKWERVFRKDHAQKLRITK